MNNLKFDSEENKYFFEEEDGYESPCIVSLFQKSEDIIKFWSYDFDSYEFCYFFTIFDLNNLIIREEGEFLTRATIYRMKNSTDELKQENPDSNHPYYAIEVFFRKPKLITFLANFSNDSSNDKIIRSFKCPKSGNHLEKIFFENILFQDWMVLKKNIEINSNIIILDNEKEEKINNLFNLDYLSDILINEIEKSTQNFITKTNMKNDHLYEIISKKFYEDSSYNVVKIIGLSNCFSLNNTATYEQLDPIKKSDFFSKSQDIKNLLNEFLNKLRIRNNNLIYFKFEKNDENINQKNLSFPKISCFCSKSFGYNLQISDLFNDFQNLDFNSSDNLLTFSNENILKEIRKEVLKKAEVIYNQLENFFKNTFSGTFEEYYFQNYSLVFELILDSMKEDCFKLNLIEIKPFEHSLKHFERIFINKHGNYKKLDTWHNFLFEKSYDYLLQNKTILCVGYMYSIMAFYEYCRLNKTKLYFLGLFLPIPDNKDLEKYITPDNFFKANFYEPEFYEQEMERLLKELALCKIDGLVVFTDDLIPFKVLLQEKLNIKYKYKTSFDEMMICMDKIEYLQKLRRIEKETDATNYIVDVEVVTDETIKAMTFKKKKVFKPSKANGSFCVEIIDPMYKLDNNNKIFDEDSTRQYLQKIFDDNKNYVKTLPINIGYGFFFKHNFLVTDYLEGTEHTITLIMSEGKCIWYLISDVISYKNQGEEFYYEKECNFPSKILKDQKENDQIRDIMVEKILQLNLPHGCVNIDFKKTPESEIKIFDINPRSANWYYRDWGQKITGVSIFKAEACLNLPIKYHCVEMPHDSIIKGSPVFTKEELEKINCDFTFKNANYSNAYEWRDCLAEVCWIERLLI